MNDSCVFCKIIEKKEYVFENELAVAFYDAMPASKGHMLIIPKSHKATYFDLTKEEMSAMFELSQVAKKHLDELYHPDGYNVGFNVGVAGGQSVFHAHMHVIPRYSGDVENPRGGIRKLAKVKK